MAFKDDLELSFLVLRAAAQVVDGIQRGLAERGFTDVRPAHGYVFVRISAGDATAVDIASHLGVTKQAASQMVEHLVESGYIKRQADPRDGRSKLLKLTARGIACTRAAEEAAAATVGIWKMDLGDKPLRSMQTALRAVSLPGPLRSAW